MPVVIGAGFQYLPEWCALKLLLPARCHNSRLPNHSMQKKVRVSVCANSGRNCSQVQSTFVLQPNASSEQVLAQLEKTARNKLRIPQKKAPLRFFLRHKGGVELSAANIEQELFCNDNDTTTHQQDIILHVSTGEPFISPQGRVTDSGKSKIMHTLKKPPRWPFPFGEHQTAASQQSLNASRQHQVNESTTRQQELNENPPRKVSILQGDPATPDVPLESTELSKSPFANLDGNILKAVTQLARSNPYISIKDQDDGVVSVDYSDIAAFQEVSSTSKKNSKLLSECRGLLLSADGRVLARRFHKFYNVHETNNHHSIESIDVTGAWLMEKLDGFLVSPYLPPISSRGSQGNGSSMDNDTVQRISWATRRETSLYVESLVSRLGSETYLPFVQYWLNNGYTPIFECISDGANPKRPHKGIVSYTEDNLVLIAIRHNISGLYVAWDQVIASVESLSVSSLPVARVLRRVGSNENLDQIVQEGDTKSIGISWTKRGGRSRSRKWTAALQNQDPVVCEQSKSFECQD